ncbi:MAG: HAMP domain-containing sensor histidine kinase [Isosphaeraceae bacterium]|nr:HAMP domain-containing sensor histidine kinase [Isosphaeraceae bacterium]
MRWTLQRRILLPLVLIHGAVICAITAITVQRATERSERGIVERLREVVETLQVARFPWTDAVLIRMRGLSGAEFVVYDGVGEISATSLLPRESAPSIPTHVAIAQRLDHLDDAPIVRVGQTDHHALLVEAAGVARRSRVLVLYPLNRSRDERLEAATPSLILGGSSLILMTVAGSWIAHGLRSRISEAARKVAEVEAGRFEPVRVGPERDEISDLLRSIDSMCAQLRSMSRTIRETERARLLSQFAAGLAHQMRNAIAGARMSLQLHERRCASAREEESLRTANRQLVIAEEQLQGILSLGRVEDRPAREVEVSSLLTEIGELLGASCEHARVRLEIDPPADPMRCEVRESGLRSALLNLALNAIDAAGPGGRVRISARPLESGAEFVVSDTGPGPAPEIASTLFEPFVSGKPEGVGVGLALADQVAKDHAGSIGWSRESGETRFVLTIGVCERDGGSRT